MTISTPNPLSLLNDQDLYDTSLLLVLGCGRAHTILKKRNRDKYCFLQTLLNIELSNRGKPVPVPPYSAPKRPKRL